MRNQPRKAVIKHKPTTRHTSLAGVHRGQVNKAHKHACTNPSCRLVYEDNCFAPELNGRCQPCRGMRRTWVTNGRTAMDPRPCCHRNTELVTDPDDLERYQLAGPGPWFQCLTCRRAHGHPCTDPDLLNRPIEVANRKDAP